MRKLAVILGAILALAVVGAAFADTSVTINELNNSGISGTAQLIDKGSQTEVIVTLTGEPSGASEPAHIHAGQCGPTLGKVVYPLKNIENGKSDTIVNAPLDSIENGQFAINVHQSAANISTYVACGNIPAMAVPITSLPKTGGAPIALVVVVGGALVGTGYALRRRSA
jgi:LPXTG-motif cell wall-anchored protein